MNPRQLRRLVIRPVLELLEADSAGAENLLLGTAAQESRMGEYIKQIHGPARGIYQMEYDTHEYVWEWLMREEHAQLARQVRVTIGGVGSLWNYLAGNLYYATAMARVRYLMDPVPIPSGRNIPALGKYWKRVWNTHAGKGTVKQFVTNWDQLVKGRK